MATINTNYQLMMTSLNVINCIVNKTFDSLTKINTCKRSWKLKTFIQ